MLIKMSTCFAFFVTYRVRQKGSTLYLDQLHQVHEQVDHVLCRYCYLLGYTIQFSYIWFFDILKDKDTRWLILNPIKISLGGYAL